MSDHFPVFFIRHFKTEKKRAKITKTRKITEITKTNFKNLIKDFTWDNMSDHFPVFFIRHFKTEKKRAKITKTRKITEITKTNFKNLIKDFTWDSVINEHDPQQAFSKFFDIFNGAFNLSFPETENKPNKNKIRVICINVQKV